jgi:hypothetical protein
MSESAVAEARETVWFPFTGASRFVRLSARAGSSRFKHEVLRVGRWVHPDTQQVLEFSREDLEEIAQCTNEWIALGHKVWFPDGHSSDAVKNLGFCDSFRVEGDVLVCDFDVPDPVTAAKVGKTIVDVSAGIQWGAKASDGTEFPVVIYHVAATPCPVIPGQGNFQKYAKELSMGGNASATRTTATTTTAELGAEDRREGNPKKYEPTAGAPEGETERPEGAALADGAGKTKQDGDDSDEHSSDDTLSAEGDDDELPAGDEAESAPGLMGQIKSALGLAADAADETVLEAIKQLCQMADNDGGVPVAGISGVMSKKLSREVELARAEATSLRTELSQERTARASEKVEAARKASMKAGILLPPERAKRALELLSRDDAQSKADGQAILDDHAARIADRAALLAKAEGEGFRIEPDEADESKKAKKREIALGKKALLEADGHIVELSKDGTEIKSFERRSKRK